MEPVDAVSLFKTHHPSASPLTTDDDNNNVRRLFKELEYLPLAIIQVSAYLEMNRGILTVSQYPINLGVQKILRRNYSQSLTTLGDGVSMPKRF